MLLVAADCESTLLPPLLHYYSAYKFQIATNYQLRADVASGELCMTNGYKSVHKYIYEYMYINGSGSVQSKSNNNKNEWPRDEKQNSGKTHLRVRPQKRTNAHYTTIGPVGLRHTQPHVQSEKWLNRFKIIINNNNK